MAAFDPSGQHLATLSDIRDHAADRTVRVFAADTGQLLRTFGGRQAGWVHWLRWSHNGSRLALARDHCVEVWDAVTGDLVARVEPTHLAGVPPVEKVHWVDFAPGDQRVVFGSSAGLCVHDLRTGRLVAQHADFHDRSVFRGAFSPDGSRLAVVAFDDTARIYDTHSWQLLQVLHGVMTRSRGLAWNHRGTRLYTVGGCLQSWYVGERPFLPVAKGLPGRLVSARYSQRGERIVAANADGDVRVFDTEHLRELAALSTGVPLRDARLLGTGSRLLLLGNDVPTRLAAGGLPDLALGTVPATAAFELGDGRIVLTGADGEVRVHDPSTGALLHSVKCHAEAIVARRATRRDEQQIALEHALSRNQAIDLIA
jgi:WD40 repeat protein